MADIHGWIWILVGLFIVGVSLYVGNLRFFILAGCAFIIWGSFKLVRDYVIPLEKPRRRPWEETLKQSASPEKDADAGNTDIGNIDIGKGVHAVPCPSCKTKVWNTAYFCHFCGLRLKK